MRLRDVAITFALCLALALLWRGWRECSARGGQYVRGLVWMECVR